MANKTDWLTLSHEQKVRVLAEMPMEQIVEQYEIEGQDAPSFREILAREIRLWEPTNIQKFEEAGSAPTKDYETKPERSRMIHAANSSHPK